MSSGSWLLLGRTHGCGLKDAHGKLMCVLRPPKLVEHSSQDALAGISKCLHPHRRLTPTLRRKARVCTQVGAPARRALHLPYLEVLGVSAAARKHVALGVSTHLRPHACTSCCLPSPTHTSGAALASLALAMQNQSSVSGHLPQHGHSSSDSRYHNAALRHPKFRPVPRATATHCHLM